MSGDLLRDLQRLSGNSTLLSCNDFDNCCLGAIDRHKTATKSTPPVRPHTYVNPNYKPAHQTTSQATSEKPQWAPSDNTSKESKDIVIGGVAFESSKNKLTRKGGA